MRYLTILGHQLYEATRLPPRGGYVCTSVSLSLARSFCPTTVEAGSVEHPAQLLSQLPSLICP